MQQVLPIQPGLEIEKDQVRHPAILFHIDQKLISLLNCKYCRLKILLSLTIKTHLKEVEKVKDLGKLKTKSLCENCKLLTANFTQSPKSQKTVLFCLLYPARFPN